jgi:hypothetical protein
MTTNEFDFSAIRPVALDLIAQGEDGFRAMVMASWIVREGITVEAARERVGDLWLD